jgi:Acetylornithine deacetylase/Succinyl-diaminopimelate desuccinylase and related deacylases
MSHSSIYEFVDNYWDTEVMPTLQEYVSIPCKSVGFDKDWKKHGYIDQATDLFEQWLTSRNIDGLTVERLEFDGRTPLLYVEIPGQLNQTILFYGHLDKQPENSGWDDNKGPWKPVVENNKLYGRGAADDGYAMFSAITAVIAAQAQGAKHASIKMIIEASEESGSPDLATYIKALEEKNRNARYRHCIGFRLWKL